MNDAIDLFMRGEHLGQEVPQLYIAMPLSQIEDPREREHLELLEDNVCQGVRQATIDREDDVWEVRVHSPLKHTSPWRRDHLDADDVYLINTEIVWSEIDGMVVIGHHGASLGAGQEIVWAAALSLPIVYTAAESETISRQVAGMAREYDIEIIRYVTPEDLRDQLQRWLASRRHQICDGPRRRRARAERFDGIRERLESAWNALAEEERGHALHTARLSRARVERLVGDVHVLASASVHELHALIGALGTGAEPPVSSLPDLRSHQIEALKSAAVEFDWTLDRTFDLYRAARLELARGGVRRLPFASIGDWQRFASDIDA
jgi:hypothetical protein